MLLVLICIRHVLLLLLLVVCIGSVSVDVRSELSLELLEELELSSTVEC